MIYKYYFIYCDFINLHNVINKYIIILFNSRYICLCILSDINHKVIHFITCQVRDGKEKDNIFVFFFYTNLNRTNEAMNIKFIKIIVLV